MPAIGSSLLAAALPVLAAIYIMLALASGVLQRKFAPFGRRMPVEPAPEPLVEPEPPWPSVDVVVPCFNEDPEVLRRCLGSILGQRYEGPLRLWVVDDGSSNRSALQHVYDEFTADARCELIPLPQNRGKRRAQDAAVRKGEAEIVVNIDSDTTVAPHALQRIVRLFREPRVAMATGNVHPSNRDDNHLTGLMGMRYRLLFQFERGAQSRFVSVICCSGSFSAYRRSAIEEVWSQYVGRSPVSIPGEDLHLTVRLLTKNYHSLYEPRAVAKTTVPATLRTYMRQQLRWNRSFYRELPEIIPLLVRRPAYLTLDVAARFLLPLLLPIALLVAVGGAMANSGTLVRDVVLLGVMAASHLAVVIWQTRDPRFCVLYGLLYVSLLIPIRLYALVTTKNSSWGTRRLLKHQPSLVRSG
jgi:N-acetylglucosaminyltransferase